MALARWRATGVHYLPAAISATGFAGHLKRIAQVQEWLTNSGVKKLSAQCRKLPVMPKLYKGVAAELESPTGSLDKVAHFVAKDPLMTAKILQVINSASFALDRQINDVCEAVMHLGMGRTRALILMAGTFPSSRM
ncbi:MAG: HDOD domain-containing protein [Verrucomicrobiota bacterium]